MTISNRPIKILFVVNSLKRRGAEQQLFSFIKEISDDIEIEVFRFSTGDDEFPEMFKFYGISIISSRYSGKYNFLKLKQLYDHVVKEKHQIIVTIGLGAALFFGRLVAVLCGTKIIYSFLNTLENFHSLPKLPDDYFDIFNRVINVFIPQLGRKRIYRFLPNSQILTQKIRTSTNSYPVTTLYNGFIRKDFEAVSVFEPNEKLRILYDQFKTHLIIIQVGALDVNKNQRFTLDCIKDISKRIPEVRLLFIGNGNEKNELMRWTFVNGLKKNVIFAGKIERTDCFFLMSKSNVLALSSISESFPNVLVEAQMLGLPVVTFDVGAAPEIIEHIRSGYVVAKGDHESFKDCIYKILKDKNKSRAMGQVGRERVLDLFSMEKKVSQFLGLMKEDLSMLKANENRHKV